MSHRTLQIQGLGLLMLALLFVFTIPYYANRIPEVLTSSAHALLQQRGITWAGVQAHGRDLVLSGSVPDANGHRHALQTVHEIFGVRHIVDRLQPTIIRPYTMSIDWYEGRLTMQGLLPDDATIQALRQQLGETFGSDNVSSKLEVAYGNPDGWTDLLGVLLNWMERLVVARVQLADRQLQVSGKAKSTEMREQFAEALAAFEQRGYAVDLHVLGADAAAQYCQQKFDELLETPIFFESGKAHVSPQSHALLVRLAETALLCPESDITIAGHTDDQGDSRSNLALSERRARAVAKQLFREGIGNSRIQTVGYGATQPVADNTSEAGRAENRRIEFVVQGN